MYKPTLTCVQEVTTLSHHGGDLNGFVMVRGSAEKLAQVREDEALLDLLIEASYCLEGFGIVAGYIGEALMDVLSRWSKLIGS